MNKNICPKCGATMYGNTQLILGGKNKHYKECPDCKYKTDPK